MMADAGDSAAAAAAAAAGDTGAGAAAAAPKERAAATASAHNLMAEGRRAMVKSDLSTAADSFEAALQIMVQTFGELGNECAEAYHRYGTCMLEIAKLESPLMAGAPAAGGEEDGGDDADAAAAAGGAASAAGTSNAEEEGEGDEGGEEEETPETIQIAWEVLETARVLYERMGKAAVLKLAEVLYDIGECAVELGMFDNAVRDYGNCLKLREENADDDHRLVAEAHFSLAFAHQYNKDFQDAIKQFKLAKQRIQKAIDALSEGKSGKSAASPEADNLRSVLEDIDRKIEDTLGDETAARSEVAAARAALGLGGGSTSIGFGDAAAAAPSSAGAPDGKTLASRMAPASSGIVETIGFGAPAAAVAPAGGAKDLSSLIKRKAKAPESKDERSEPSAKRARVAPTPVTKPTDSA